MTAAEIRAKAFWSAAFYLRRAPERNPAIALKVLGQVAEQSTGQVRDRADALLREIENGKRYTTYEG